MVTFESERREYLNANRSKNRFGPTCTAASCESDGLSIRAVSAANSGPVMYHHAATIVDKILKGAKPTDLPVEQATKFVFAINLKTARALELSVFDKLLA